MYELCIAEALPVGMCLCLFPRSAFGDPGFMVPRSPDLWTVDRLCCGALERLLLESGLEV